MQYKTERQNQNEPRRLVMKPPEYVNAFVYELGTFFLQTKITKNDRVCATSRQHIYTKMFWKAITKIVFNDFKKISLGLW